MSNNLKLYHQCGFRSKWNFEVFQEDNIGDGFILSPYNMKKEELSKIEDEELEKSFFDPQFYALGDYRDSFLSYNFLDCVDTLSDYINDRDFIAQKTVDYQNNLSVEYITIPTIDFDLLNTTDDFEYVYSLISSNDYEGNDNNLKILNEIIIKPFIKRIKEIETNKKILLTVIFDENTARNNDKFAELLTLITSYDIVDGIYIIPKCSKSYKRVSNIQFLQKMMEFIDILKSINMEVIVGNSDIESLLYIVAGADAVTMGSYENLRHYDGTRFIKNEGTPRSPVPRLFSYKLLQWIDYTYLYPISQNIDMNDLFECNKYYEMTVPEGYKWHFSKSEPYKHYMMSCSNLIKKLPQEQHEKIEYVNQLFEEAKKAGSELLNCGIILDDNSGGAHISQWQTALLQFANKKKKGD